MLIKIIVPIRELQKRNRKDEKAQIAMFSALWVPWRTSVSLPSRRTRSISPLSLRSSSFYFSFGLRCSLPFQLSCLRFTRSCDPHTALLLQWPVVPLSARSRAKYISSCSFTTTNKDIQITFLSQSDLTTSRPLRPRWRTNPALPGSDFRLTYDWRYNVIVIRFGEFISVFLSVLFCGCL